MYTHIPYTCFYAKYVRIFLPRMSYLISTLLLEPLGNLSINLPDNHLSSNITINNPQSTAHPASSIYQQLVRVLHQSSGEPPSLPSPPPVFDLEPLRAFITENASPTWSQFFLSQCYSTLAAHQIALNVGNETPAHEILQTPTPPPSPPSPPSPKP
jgi:hypothetical protein